MRTRLRISVRIGYISAARRRIGRGDHFWRVMRRMRVRLLEVGLSFDFRISITLVACHTKK